MSFYKYRLVFPALLAIIFQIEAIYGQPHIGFNHLTVENGLSQRSVTCIFQDSQGFMWFGTQDGLNRYDGYNFRIFKNDPADSTSLKENFIFSIYEDKNSVLYIETRDGTLHQFHSRSESFKIIQRETVNLNSFRVSTVGARLYEPSGIVWTGGLSKETGLVKTNTGSGEITTFRHDPSDPASLSSDKVYSIFRDRSGNLWVGTNNGLDRLNEKTGKFYHYRNDPKDPFSLSDNWVWPIYQDSRGNLWVGTVRNGLCLFDPDEEKFYNYKKEDNDPSSLSDDFIFSIYEDLTGLIWIGTNLGGINYFNPANQAFNHYIHDPSNDNSLSDNVVTAMLVDREGNYWIGTRTGGLNHYNPRTKKFTHYKNDPSNTNSLISNSVQTLLEDGSGRIWIGTYGNGLDVFDPKRQKFTHYTHNPAISGTITDNRIYDLLEQEKGDIWIGTYGGGLNRIDKKTGEILKYQQDESNASTLSSNSTWTIAEDNSGNLWVGTLGGGINVFDIKAQKFSQFRNVPDDSTSIIDDSIVRVFKDSDGNMWIGTIKGLSRYVRESNNFKNYTEKDGLANSFVLGIVEDDQGNLWLSTNNGLSRFDPEKETFKNYYDKDGLQGNEFNQNAFAKNPHTGELLFGGTMGFNVFHPDSLKANAIPPPIAFTSYLRYNTDDEEGKPIKEKGISVRDSIDLTYKDNIITLDFSALSFYNNFDNQYRYKLEGFNENWIQLGSNHTVTFTNLSPDEYVLRVIGSNNDDVWNETGATLNILVTPPWWKTNTAYFIYFVILFGILYALRRFEIKQREQKAQIRESELIIKATEAEKRALEIENERKTKELEEARKLQLSMLPKKIPEHKDLEIAAFMRTASEVGGDYYDFMMQDDGTLNIAFGDATGHGLQAGTMVTLMKGFFTSDASRMGLEEFLNHCSEVIKDINLGRILMSFSYLKYDSKKLYVTSGGMPPIYFHHKDKNEVEEIFIPGIPLGAIRNAEYSTTEMDVKSGDTILLLTDGLPEAMNKKEEMFDYPRVQKSFIENINHDAETIIEKLVAAGDKWMGERPQDDDITMVVIRVK